MVPNNRFRSALNGFNREDVVNYIEYLNHQHRTQVEQLTNQLQLLRDTPQEAPEIPSEDTDRLKQQLQEALDKCAQLEAKLQQVPAAQPTASTAAEELEAYRRAERAERLAQERAQQIYAQANAALAEAAQQAETAAAHIGTVADQAAAQLKECQQSVAATKSTFQDAVATLYAIRPEIPEE